MITFLTLCAIVNGIHDAKIEPVAKEKPAIVQKVNRHKEMREIGNFSITAYDICFDCCGKTDWITYTDTIAKAGRTIAVDPNVIPYGSKVYIEGIGYRIAEDKGGGINGKDIDLLFETHAEALKFGRQTRKVYIVE